MVKRILFLIALIGAITSVIYLWTDGSASFFFREARVMFIGAIVIGVLLGIIGGLVKRIAELRTGKELERHPVDSTMEHWGTAIGIFILIISGYQVRFHPGFAPSNLHFLGLFITLLFGSYFLADFFVSKKYNTLLPDGKDIVDGTIRKYLLNKKIKETGKYLGSQKSSFLAFVVIGGQIVISGTIKLLVFYMSIPQTLLQTATRVHDISAVLFVMLLIVHVFLVLTVRANRVLLPSWFIGRGPKEPHSEPEDLLEDLPQPLPEESAENPEVEPGVFNPARTQPVPAENPDDIAPPSVQDVVLASAITPGKPETVIVNTEDTASPPGENSTDSVKPLGKQVTDAVPEPDKNLPPRTK